MPHEISRRHRRFLTRASSQDVWRILCRQRFYTPDYVELLVARVDELAECDALESFELGAGALLPIFRRAADDLSNDLMARGFAALGQASRRLGRFAKAEAFYDRAWSLRDLGRSTWIELYWKRAVLALEQLQFERAMNLARRSLSLASNQEERVAPLIVCGIIDINREHFGSAGIALRKALAISPPDSDLQFVALGNLAENHSVRAVGRSSRRLERSWRIFENGFAGGAASKRGSCEPTWIGSKARCSCSSA